MAENIWVSLGLLHPILIGVITPLITAGDGAHLVGDEFVDTWRIIPVSKWLGSPPFGSHEVWPFGRGPTLPDP